MKMFLALAVLFLGFTAAFAQHEYAPIQEREIKYKNFNYKSVRDDKTIDLREFAAGKKLVMVVYLAAWCPNWRLEAPVAQRLYDKYKKHGFDVLGVSEYASIADTRASLEKLKVTFPVVSESESLDAKKKTAHYDYRKTLGDLRNWGTPWNIFLEPANLEKKGDTLLKKAFVASGELVEVDAEKFIRQRLGLPAEEIKKATTAVKDKAIEVCEPEKKTVAFVRP